MTTQHLFKATIEELRPEFVHLTCDCGLLASGQFSACCLEWPMHRRVTCTEPTCIANKFQELHSTHETILRLN